MSSLQPHLWAAEFVTFPAATIFLILRLSSRRITRVRLWWDDYFAVLCYAVAVAWAIMLPIWIRHGFGLHSDDVQGMTIEEANYATKKYLFIIEHLYAFTLFFAKISILSFYWRMFRVANIQFAISILLTCSILWIIVRVFLTTFHCYPVEAFWDPHIEHSVCPIKSADFFFGTVLAHVLIDVGILILPIVQIQKLQLPILQKIAMIFLFLFGILVCVAGMVIVSVSAHFNNKSDDMTYQLAPIIIWASVEVNLVTISSMRLPPSVRPLSQINSLLCSLSPYHSTGLSIPDDLHGPNFNDRFQIQRVPPQLPPNPNQAFNTSFKVTQCRIKFYTCAYRTPE
ncbi:hypothetical protein FVEN_g2947 [Fusarium venenatum]|nr:hypothetical protein FVEN_g2947 [Fusarium venenatum]